MSSTLPADAVWIIRDALNSSEVESLRSECAHCSQVAQLSSEEWHDRSCALDLFENSSLTETAEERTNRTAYLRERWRRLTIDETTRKVIEGIIFSTLPAVIKEIVGVAKLFLFNEHYIVKPAGSDLQFSWHIDEERQLGFLSPEEMYFTLWCPLDETTDRNGTLVVSEKTNIIDSGRRDERPMKRRRRSDECERPHNKNSCGIPILVKPGTVVLFSSKLPHRSGPNFSGVERRVFYSQYSTFSIGGSRAPLSFAICTDEQ